MSIWYYDVQRCITPVAVRVAVLQPSISARNDAPDVSSSRPATILPQGQVFDAVGTLFGFARFGKQF